MREILSILVRYGFQSVLEDLNLDRLILKSRKFFGAAAEDETVDRLPTQVRLRQAMEQLGPTFIKLGQVLSTRPDLIPPQWAEEFTRLQGDVPPVEFEKVAQRLAEEFGDDWRDMFESVDEQPLAAASIAQVHRAVLSDGQRIVLKVVRPGIRDVIASDMDILRILAEFAEEHFSNLGYSPTDVVQQFADELEREVDLTREARAIERMAGGFEDNDTVHFPSVFWEATSPNVLAMEEIRGTLLSKLNVKDLSDDERTSIVATGTDAVFRQCLELGFFHADPHPGNIFSLGDGKLCFIDCGMVGHIDPDTAGQLAELVHGVINGELNRVIDVIITLSGTDPAIAENRAFRADVWQYMSHFDVGSFDKLDICRLLNDFFERLRRHNLRCPADIVFLIKAITTIEGVGERIAPSFDIAAHVQPYVERLVRKRYGIGALRRRLQSSMLGYAQLAESLPMQMRTLLANLRRKQFTVNLEHQGIEELEQTIDRASANVAHAVFLASMIVGSSLLVLADAATEGTGALTYIAIIGFLLAITLAGGRIVLNYLRR